MRDTAVGQHSYTWTNDMTFKIHTVADVTVISERERESIRDHEMDD